MNARTIFKVAAIAGVPLTGYLSARGSFKYEEILRKNGEPLTKVEKAKDMGKSYWPALVAGGVTIGSILISDNLAAKAIAAASATATLALAKKDAVKSQFESYREAVKEDAGEAKDIEYIEKAAEVKFDEDGEVLHRFKINWMKEPIYFESTYGDVQHALNEINRELIDYCTGCGVVTVSDALRLFGHKELRTKETDRAGWSYDLLANTCDCYFLDFYIYKVGNGLPDHGDEDPETVVIDVIWPPEENLEYALKEAEREGII